MPPMTALTRVCLGVLLIGGCERSSGTTSPEPTRSTPATDSTTPASSCPAPAGPADFHCAREVLCQGNRGAREPVTLHSLLCAADGVPGRSLEIGDILARLPPGFRANVTLKHGTQPSLLRGHPIEDAATTTSADVDAPRVMLWDHTSGFSVSFNGGLTPATHRGRHQKGANRFAFLSFDATVPAFSLWALDVPVTKRGAHFDLTVTQPGGEDDCKICHGPRSRPIWPMYPDWPGFFGSDNDELTRPTKHQVFERERLADFRECLVTGSRAGRCGDSKRVRDTRRRYSQLYSAADETHAAARFGRVDKASVRGYLGKRRASDGGRKLIHRLGDGALGAIAGSDADLRSWLGLTLHALYPYRPDHAEALPEASRAFAHRPNSRVGILYNRLNAQTVMAHVREQATYTSMRKLYAFAFMDCGWGAHRDAAHRVASALSRASKHPLAPLRDGRLLYADVLATLGLELRDVDIRFSYPNPRFDRFDAEHASRPMAETIMSLGYLAYDVSDRGRHDGATHYFNSYFDGSASFDELLVAMVLADIGAMDSSYRELYELASLTEKYKSVSSRFALDAAFLAQMDAHGRWFPLPYPARLAPDHHRQSFLRRRRGAMVWRDQHRAVCARLASDLAAPQR